MAGADRFSPDFRFGWRHSLRGHFPQYAGSIADSESSGINWRDGFDVGLNDALGQRKRHPGSQGNLP